MPQASSNVSSTSAPRKRTRKAFPTVFILLAVGLIAICGGAVITSFFKHSETTEIADITSDTSEPNTTSEEKKPDFLDLQPVIDEWLNNTNAEVGLMIYDLDNSRVAASYNAEQIFSVASIYKLFFVYAGYQQIENGANADEFYITTGDYRADDYTLGECLDLMIRESYNGCADPMHEDPLLSQAALTLIDELELENTSEFGLYSTAADLTKLLIRYWEHPDLSTASWEKIADSMLNQPATEIEPGVVYDWRQGLPSGFNATKVYDKVGWSWTGSYWDTYADAAFLDTGTRHYSVVVLTSGIADPNTAELRKLGEQIENTIYD